MPTLARASALALSALVLFPSAVAAQEWTATQAGGVSLRLYTPAAPAPAAGRPLLIVLHGCSQQNAALQNGGNLEATAEAQGALVALPAVPNGGVVAGCWDYYGELHTRANRHNGPLLAMTAALRDDAELGVDPDRVWIAGLSSGASQAMVMGCLAPDVYAGVGIAAGPTVGTSQVEIGQVATNLARATALCTRLAGDQAAHLATQLTAVVVGDRDFVVAQGYGPLNAQVAAALYDAPDTAPVDVAALPGAAPAGQGTVWADAFGPRVALLQMNNLDHAWPAGGGGVAPAPFVNGGGLDFGAFLGQFFVANDRRGDRAPVAPRVTRLEATPDAANAAIDVRGAATPAARLAGVTVTLNDARPTAAALAADGTFTARFDGLDFGTPYVARALARDVDGGESPALAAAAVTLIAPGANAPPVVMLDAVEAEGDCLVAQGTVRDDGAVAEVTLAVAEREAAAQIAGEGFTGRVCGLAPGCHTLVARAVDDLGARAETRADPVGLAEGGWVEVAEGNITDHVPRFATYDHGYGTADATYVDLLNQHGVNGVFPLYRDAEGDWYADAANIGGGEPPMCAPPPPPDAGVEPDAAPPVDAGPADADPADAAPADAGRLDAGPRADAAPPRRRVTPADAAPSADAARDAAAPLDGGPLSGDFGAGDASTPTEDDDSTGCRAAPGHAGPLGSSGRWLRCCFFSRAAARVDPGPRTAPPRRTTDEHPSPDPTGPLPCPVRRADAAGLRRRRRRRQRHGRRGHGRRPRRGRHPGAGGTPARAASPAWAAIPARAAPPARAASPARAAPRARAASRAWAAWGAPRPAPTSARSRCSKPTSTARCC
ncbi:MAG: PHB depolymerase family esterase [Myxococcales bacterium]|nr:PHB depolymerase family esterase [Myxococcales bacterium]